MYSSASEFNTLLASLLPVKNDVETSLVVCLLLDNGLVAGWCHKHCTETLVYLVTHAQCCSDSVCFPLVVNCVWNSYFHFSV